MISHIHGRARQWNAEAQSVEVEVGGLCYEVLLPTYCWRALEHRPAEVDLYTYYHVPERNPIPVLIGFLRPVEREFFKKFMRVHGLGPLRAQRALAVSVSTIAHWIESEDKTALRRLPGIGTRQAEQIVAALRGKVVEEALLLDEHFSGPAAAPAAAGRAQTDAVEALVNLGYPKRQAQEWVQRATTDDLAAQADLTAEDILRAVLQRRAGEA